MQPHKYPIITRRLLSAEVVKGLSGHPTRRWLGVVTLEWAIVWGAIACCLQWGPAWAHVLCALFVGTRQHALSILGHEGVHHSVASSRRVNDLLANYLTCYPLMISVQGYRTSHLEHHWHLETPDDPSKVSVDHHPADWAFPMSPARFVGLLSRDLSGLSQASSASLLKYLWMIPNRGWHLAQVCLAQVALVCAFWALGDARAYLWLWVLPMFTVVIACYRVRGIAEHTGMAGEGRPPRFGRHEVDALTATRTTVLAPWVAALFAPYGVSYHIEHHLYPSVPAFELGRLHRLLAATQEYQEHAHLTRGYRGLFAELTGRAPSFTP